MDTVDKFLQCIKRGDTQGPFALASDDCMVRFENDMEMPWEAYVKANEEVKASFPDFSISVSKKVVSGNKISLVGCVVSGTHTGTLIIDY
jgi:ketosteroid isomerase-like protein